MSILGSIMSKIFHSAPAASPAPDATAATPDAAAPAAGSPQANAPAAQPVDVEAVLTQMASQKGGGGNWQDLDRRSAEIA